MASPKEIMSLPEKIALVIVSLLLIILPIIVGTVKHVTGLYLETGSESG